MRKAYRITGSSFERPENLPEGFTVKERLVGESLELSNGLSFQEVKDGTVVAYRKDQSGSNVKLSRDDQWLLMVFLNRNLNAHVVHINEFGHLKGGT